MHKGHLGDVHSSLKPGESLVKVGVIDWGCNGTLSEFDKKSFKSLSIGNQSHSIICKDKSDTMICARGFSCASIICGTRRDAKFFDVCEKEFEGIYPEAQLHIYSIGCGNCRLSMERNIINATVKALDKAIKDNVKVILLCMDMPKNNYKHIKDDRVGMKLLDVHKNGSLPIVPTGDKGPAKGSTQYGGPWCMTVGACTGKQILETDIEIAAEDRDGKISTKEWLKGVSLNVRTTQFLQLCVHEDVRRGNEGILKADISVMKCYLIPAHSDYRSIIVGPNVTVTPLAAVTKAQVNRLLQLFTEHGKRLFLRILGSKYNEDKGGDLVTGFSSRGPSRLYQHNLIPDVVASGYGILTPHPTNIALNNEYELPLFGDMTIASGTSYACAQVAAYASKVFSRHPDWLPSAVKSALITTASNFRLCSEEEGCIPGNELAYGAGSINIERALDPGLVYEESSDHFDEYVEQDRTIFDLNLPTFAASFPYSHRQCERVFKRELKNVSGRDESYKCVVTIFEKSLNPNVDIKAEPDFLTFRPGEKQKFELRVKVLPRPGPGTQVAATIKWEPGTVDYHPVCSPIYLYHHSKFDD